MNTQLQLEKATIEISTLEQERRRLASDLHDEVAPLLSVIKMSANKLKPRSKEELRHIENMKSLLQDVIQKMREVYYDLIPSNLHREGLVAAVHRLRNEIMETSELQVDVKVEGVCCDLHPEKQLQLFRIVQEALHNTLKHAGARTFVISLKQQRGKVEMEMKDDGRGFNPLRMKRENFGRGLSNISNRVDVLEGEYYLDSRPGKGVRHTVIIPTDSTT